MMLKRRLFIWIVILILLYIVGANLQAGLIYLIISVGISMIAAAYFLNRLSLRKVYGRRILPPYLFSGEKGVIRYEINSLPLHGRIIDREFGVEEEVAGDCILVKEIELKRGIYRSDGYEIESTYPGGFFKSKKFIKDDVEVIVYPSFDEVELKIAAGFGWGAEETFMERREGTDFLGVREYRSGDSYRHIHWKKSAKSQSLHVKTVSLPQRLSMIVFLDNRIETQNENETFELSVSAAATMIRYFMNKGFETDLLYFHNHSLKRASGSFEDLLFVLAGIEPAPSSSDASILKFFDADVFDIAGIVYVSSPDEAVAFPEDVKKFSKKLLVTYPGRRIEIDGARQIVVTQKGSERYWYL